MLRPAVEFYKNAKAKDGLRCDCKPCRHMYYIANKIKRDAYAKEWARLNPERVRATQRKTHLKNNYGMTCETYAALANKQKHKCAICEIKLTQNKLHVDHCHKTGRVRGLLCGGCNRGLGLFKDSVKALSKAIVYLKKQRR